MNNTQNLPGGVQAPGKILYIYGNAGEGRKCAVIALRRAEYREIIFINDYATETELHIPGFLGLHTTTFAHVREHTKKENAVFLIALGEPALREALAHRVTDAGFSLAPALTYPNFSSMGVSCIGDGCVIHDGALLQPDVTVGQNCLINMSVVLGHGVEIGANSVISAGAILGGETKIGAGSYIGSGAVLRDRIRIGKNCIVGMGAVVTKDVPDRWVVVGNPARFLRENDSDRVFRK